MEFNRDSPAPAQPAEGRRPIGRATAIVLPLVLAAVGLVLWRVDGLFDL